MSVFCTVQDVADFLQIEVDETSATRAIVGATAAIKGYCKQDIELVEDDEVTFDVERDDRTKLYLPQLPVTEVASVIEDGETLVVDDDYKLGRDGVLHRIDAYWAEGIQIVEVTYTHGYEELPDTVVDVCTRAAARAYQAGLFSAALSGVPGVTSYALGDYSVGFGGVGVEGASAARLLLMSEKEELNAYRYKPYE